MRGMSRFKNRLKPDLNEITQNIYASVLYDIIKMVLGGIIAAALIILNHQANLLKRLYSGVSQMSTLEIMKLAGWMVFFLIGFGLVVWLIVSSALSILRIRKRAREIKKQLATNNDGVEITVPFQTDADEVNLLLKNGSKNDLADYLVELTVLDYLAGNTWMPFLDHVNPYKKPIYESSSKLKSWGGEKTLPFAKLVNDNILFSFAGTNTNGTINGQGYYRVVIELQGDIVNGENKRERMDKVLFVGCLEYRVHVDNTPSEENEINPLISIDSRTWIPVLKLTKGDCYEIRESKKKAS